MIYLNTKMKQKKKRQEKKCDRETKAQVNADRVDCLCISVKRLFSIIF